MPFFSIVIPAFNRSIFIKSTIESIQKQIFRDWECIVVDDGSTDDTKQVVEAIANEDKRITYIYQDNAERSAARNNGIHNSKGKYLCFLDSDDLFLENHLQSLYDDILYKEYPVAMFFTNYMIAQDGMLTKQSLPSLTDDIIDYLFYNPIIPARVCVHGQILKHEMFDEDIVIVEDLLLWVRIALKHPVFHLEKDTVVYNLHEDNSINIQNQAALKRLKGLKLFLKKHPEISIQIPKKIWSSTIGDTHFNVMKYFLYSKKKRKAIKHLLLSIYLQKMHPQLKHKIYILINLILNKNVPGYPIKKY